MAIKLTEMIKNTNLQLYLKYLKIIKHTKMKTNVHQIKYQHY